MEMTSKNQFPSKEEIKQRLAALGKTQKYLAIYHRRKPQQITQALNGDQPGLLKRILRHLEKLESKKHVEQVS